MQEHPIPQDITGYRFHLIGNMTLKQFAEILLGCLIAFIIYKTGLPAIIRWPAILLFAGTGFMAAFVPIEERPLDHWITTFFKVLFKPTKFFWKREPKIPEAFTHHPDEGSQQVERELDLSPARKNKIYQYLQSIDRNTGEQDEYDVAEQKRVNQLITGFDQVAVQSEPSRGKVKPNLKVRVRDMKNLSVPAETYETQTQPQNQPQNHSQNQQAQQVRRGQSQPPLQTTPGLQAHSSPANTQNYEEPQDFDQGGSLQQGKEKSRAKLSESAEKPDKKSALQKQPVQEKAPDTVVNTLPPPPNSLPNQISGVLMSENEELIGGAVIEVKDTSNKTVTAVKSNSLGQFVVSRQLPNGEYVLKISAGGYSFEPIKITLAGEILGALEIKASQ